MKQETFRSLLAVAALFSIGFAWFHPDRDDDACNHPFSMGFFLIGVTMAFLLMTSPGKDTNQRSVLFYLSLLFLTGMSMGCARFVGYNLFVYGLCPLSWVLLVKIGYEYMH